MKNNNKEKEDYKGFGEHLQDYESLSIPIGRKDLVRLAKQYNCKVPKMVNGELVF